VVSRRAALKGLLLPSKLVAAELSGRPVLWIGDTDGHTAMRLLKEKRHGVFRATETEAIADWLEKRFALGLAVQALPPRSTTILRKQALTQWETLLASLRPNPVAGSQEEMPIPPAIEAPSH